MKGDHYARLSQRNFVRKQEIPATRGAIVDRKGRILADSRPCYDIRVTPAFVEDPEALGRKLASILEVPWDELEGTFQRIRNSSGLSRFRPVTVARDVGMRKLSEVNARLLELDGVDVMVRPVREYPMGGFASHLLGTLGEIGREELSRLGPGSGYEQGDMIGRRGIEKAYERLLKGVDGYEVAVTDSKGRKQPESLAKELTPPGTPTRVGEHPGAYPGCRLASRSRGGFRRPEGRSARGHRGSDR